MPTTQCLCSKQTGQRTSGRELFSSSPLQDWEPGSHISAFPLPRRRQVWNGDECEICLLIMQKETMCRSGSLPQRSPCACIQYCSEYRLSLASSRISFRSVVWIARLENHVL